MEIVSVSVLYVVHPRKSLGVSAHNLLGDAELTVLRENQTRINKPPIRVPKFGPVIIPTMALQRYTTTVDGTIPIQALLYTDEQLLASQEGVGIYNGSVTLFLQRSHKIDNTPSSQVFRNHRSTRLVPSTPPHIDSSTSTTKIQNTLPSQ